MQDLDERARNWTWLAYPESSSENWVEQLRELGIPTAISPLHDKDIYVSGDKQGEFKKSHYHVVFSFDGKKNYQQVLNLVSAFGAKHVEKVHSMSGMFDYLTHKNSNDKAPYKTDDLQLLNGFKIKELSENSEFETMAEIFKYAKENSIFEMGAITDLVLENPDFRHWQKIIFSPSKSFMIKRTLDSYRYSILEK
jgi:hypothetical protein